MQDNGHILLREAQGHKGNADKAIDEANKLIPKIENELAQQIEFAKKFVGDQKHDIMVDGIDKFSREGVILMTTGFFGEGMAMYRYASSGFASMELYELGAIRASSTVSQGSRFSSLAFRSESFGASSRLFGWGGQFGGQVFQKGLLNGGNWIRVGWQMTRGQTMRFGIRLGSNPKYLQGVSPLLRPMNKFLYDNMGHKAGSLIKFKL